MFWEDLVTFSQDRQIGSRAIPTILVKHKCTTDYIFNQNNRTIEILILSCWIKALWNTYCMCPVFLKSCNCISFCTYSTYHLCFLSDFAADHNCLDNHEEGVSSFYISFFSFIAVGLFIMTAAVIVTTIKSKAKGMLFIQTIHIHVYYTNAAHITLYTTFVIAFGFK